MELVLLLYIAEKNLTLTGGFITSAYNTAKKCRKYVNIYCMQKSGGGSGSPGSPGIGGSFSKVIMGTTIYFRSASPLLICNFCYVIILYSYFSVTLPALPHFCSVIYIAYSSIKDQSLCEKGVFYRVKSVWSNPPGLFSSTLRSGPIPSGLLRLEPPL